MLTALALTLLPLAPITPIPDPPPVPRIELPRYVTQGDGTRIVCAPEGFFCWPSNDGLPQSLG